MGDKGAGKTSLIVKIVTGTFPSECKPVLGGMICKDEFGEIIPETGSDFLIKEILVGKKLIKFQFWQTQIQEELKYYLTGASLIVLCYSLIDTNQYKNVKQWLDKVKMVSDNIPIILVGCKSDLVDIESVITSPEFFSRQVIKSIKLSAKNSEGIEELNNSLIDLFM